MDTFIDSHCHLCDERIWGRSANVIEICQQRRIGAFLQGGVGPEDWRRQKELMQKYSGVLPCFGVHPYFVRDHDQEDCDQALNLLAEQIHEAWAIGEVGLDFRPHILKDKRDLQMEVFQNQVELAFVAHKPLVLHLVQCHREALLAFDLWGTPPAKGFVHGYTGSLFYAEKYWQKGFLISVGGAICHPRHRQLKNMIKEMPLEFLLVESDAPDQNPHPHKKEPNLPTSIWDVAKTIGELRDLEAEEILLISRSNFLRLFSQRSWPLC